MITDQQKTAIESAWIKHAKYQGYKPGTKKYAVQQVEFFAGVMRTLQTMFPNEDPKLMSEAVPPIWLVNVMSGRDIVTGR